MSSHTFTIAEQSGLVAHFVDATCSCGWTFTTMSSRSLALAHCEQHLEAQDAENADYDALCDL